MARSSSTLHLAGFALVALAATLPGAALADTCQPGLSTTVVDDDFEAFLDEVADTSSSLGRPVVTRHPVETDGACRRWLMTGPPGNLRATLELPSAVPGDLACVPPGDVALDVTIDDDFGPTPEATWVLAAGEPLIVLRLGLEPTFWAWDADRTCAVTWPVPALAEPLLGGNHSGDETDHTTTRSGRFPVAGGTLVLAAESHYEQDDWTTEPDRGCTMSGTVWSHDAELQWSFASSTLDTPIELASTSDGEGMSDPDDGFECEPWTRPADAMVMIHHDGGRTTLGVSDEALDAHLAACRASGSSRCTESRLEHERPAIDRDVGHFFLDRHEVTRAQYAACVEAGGCASIDASTCQIFDGDKWDDGGELPEAYTQPDMPQLCVTRAEAAAYCAWAEARLPTEAEWEAAAGGADQDTIFPWGDDWRADAAVYLANASTFGPATVGSHPAGDSPQGIADLAGNAYEWVDGEAADGVVRGGSFLSDGGALRTTSRKVMAPDARLDTHGFRCAADGADW